MRSLVELSARTDRIVELADWVEMSTFFRDDKSISEEDLARSLIREGSARFEKTAREKAEAAFDELATRAEGIGTTDETPVALYPFELDGTVLTLVRDPFGDDHAGLLYSFLLAITRASMESTSRKLKSIDPTGLFEEISAEALCQFWGGRSSVSDVFVAGTSNKTVPKQKKGRFPSIINSIASHLHEGVGWKKTARSPGAGDGGLDVVVWRRFNDKRPGALVGFAQCKTGDSWRDHLGKNNPGCIVSKYFTTPLVLSPLPIYIVPCRVDRDEWDDVMRAHSFGLLLDRCRITTFGTKLNEAIVSRCDSWLQAAIDREKQEFQEQKEIATKTVHDEAAAT